MRRDCPTSFHFSNKPFTAERRVSLSLSLSLSLLSLLFSYSFHVTLPRAHCSSTPLMHLSASIPARARSMNERTNGNKGRKCERRGLYRVARSRNEGARAYERRERFANDKRINCNAVEKVAASGAESGLKNRIRWLDDWLTTFDLLTGSQGGSYPRR